MTNSCTCKAEHWQQHAETCPAYKPKPPQCIHIPDGSVVVSGELFDQACAAIADRDRLAAEIELQRSNLACQSKEIDAQVEEIQRLQVRINGYADTNVALRAELATLKSKPVSELASNNERQVAGSTHEPCEQLCEHGIPVNSPSACPGCHAQNSQGASRDAVQRICHALTEQCVMVTDPERQPCTPENCKAVKASRDASSEKSSVERLGIIKQTPRQASIDDIEWLCEAVERLQAGILYEVENASLAPSARLRMRALTTSDTHKPEKPGYHCGKLKADCDDEFCPTHGHDIR